MTSPPLSNVYEARRLETGRSIAIDGCGRDTNWRAAHVLTDFSFPWIQTEPPPTEFRALWNEEHLFFRFDVVDADVVLGEGADAMEKVIGSDRVEVFFSTGPDLNPYYAIEMDPRGEVLDYEAKFHRQMNWRWSCDDLVVAASQTKLGYLVEASISLRTLKKLACLHRDESGDYMITGLYRAEFSHRAVGDGIIENWMSWIDPNVASPDFHVPSSFGVLRLGA